MKKHVLVVTALSFLLSGCAAIDVAKTLQKASTQSATASTTAASATTVSIPPEKPNKPRETAMENDDLDVGLYDLRAPDGVLDVKRTLSTEHDFTAVKNYPELLDYDPYYSKWTGEYGTMPFEELVTKVRESLEKTHPSTTIDGMEYTITEDAPNPLVSDTIVPGAIYSNFEYCWQEQIGENVHRILYVEIEEVESEYERTSAVNYSYVTPSPLTCEIQSHGRLDYNADM